MSYKDIDFRFENGQVLRSDNGNDYRVVDASNQSEVLFENCRNGERVIATCPRMYEKTQGGVTQIVLSWQRGKYLRKQN